MKNGNLTPSKQSIFPNTKSRLIYLIGMHVGKNVSYTILLFLCKLEGTLAC